MTVGPVPDRATAASDQSCADACPCQSKAVEAELSNATGPVSQIDRGDVCVAADVVARSPSRSGAFCPVTTTAVAPSAPEPVQANRIEEPGLFARLSRAFWGVRYVTDRGNEIKPVTSILSNIPMGARSATLYGTALGPDYERVEKGWSPDGESLGMAMNGIDIDKLVRLADPTDKYDCHGYTFLDSKGVLNEEQAALILRDNGYVKTSTPKVGDVVIYRDKAGAIVHSGLVSVVSADGQVTKVKSKWGIFSLFEHPPLYVPSSYGIFDAVYTSARQGGHKLNLKGSSH